MVFDVLDNGFAEDTSEFHRYGIADQAAKHLEVNGFAVRNESVILWEALKDGALTK